MLTLAYDQITSVGTGYPNLAVWTAEPYTSEWRKFDSQWPYSVPLRLPMYLSYAGVHFETVTVDTNKEAWYPIAFGWFDFTVDYVALIPPTTFDKIKKQQFKILFYYHEGDNPDRIQQRLTELILQHSLPKNCYVLISANTAAANKDNSIYFDDHECFFRYVNRKQPVSVPPKNSTKPYDFTVLSRTHKWWRASVVADLWRDGTLTDSLVGYNVDITLGDSPSDNPISIHTIPDLPKDIQGFLSMGNHIADQLTTDQQNDHHWVNTELYSKSYFHIILETHYDADQSGGCFFTEKTWKCIKYCQPFVFVGPAGSLAYLRSQGFKVFDHVIDNTYDTITDNTQRWLETKKTLLKIHTDPKKFWERCYDDVIHNYNLFCQRQKTAVNNLLEKLI